MIETEFRLAVNGAERSVTCEPGTPLLDVLRHDLGLAGPRFGCGMGLCGACFVLIGDRARSSCDLPVSAVDGPVTTVEGLSGGAGSVRSSRRSSMSRPPSAALDAARAGPVRPGPDHLGGLGQLPDPPVHRYPAGHGARHGRAWRSRDRRGRGRQGPVAGAIGNAVADAAGVRVRDLPLTRERVARAIQES